MKPASSFPHLVVSLLVLAALAGCGDTNPAPPFSGADAPPAAAQQPAAPAGQGAEPQPSAPRTLTLSSPANGAVVDATFELQGTAAQVPDGASLVYRFYDADGNLVVSGPAPVQGQPGTFKATVSFEPDTGGVGWLEVVDQSTSDGSVVASAAVNVIVKGSEAATAIPAGNPAIRIDTPADRASVNSPIDTRGSVANLGEQDLLNYRVYDVDGVLIGSGPVQPGAADGAFTAPAEYALDITGTGQVMIVVQDPLSGAVLGHAAVNAVLAPTVPITDDQLAADEVITIDQPVERQGVASPFAVAGKVIGLPADATLTYRLYDVSGKVIGAGPVKVEGGADGAGQFSASIPYPAGSTGAGQVELLDIDPADGMIYASALRNLFFGAAPPASSPAASQAITLESPLPGDTVSGPAQVRGILATTPEKTSLVYRIYDSAGNLVGTGPVPVTGAPGQPGTFATPITFSAGVSSVGRVQVLDIGADGSVIASATAEVFFNAAP